MTLRFTPPQPRSRRHDPCQSSLCRPTTGLGSHQCRILSFGRAARALPCCRDGEPSRCDLEHRRRPPGTDQPGRPGRGRGRGPGPGGRPVGRAGGRPAAGPQRPRRPASRDRSGPGSGLVLVLRSCPGRRRLPAPVWPRPGRSRLREPAGVTAAAGGRRASAVPASRRR
jgi:hypothetical protein